MSNESPHLTKSLRWHDGAALALPIAVGLFITAGFTIGALGTLGAIAVCVTLAVVALLQNYLFAEMAAMFPDKPGGVAVYAAEAWKRYFAPLSAVSSFGYWCGWALVLALTGLTAGSLIQAQWFADSTWSVSTGLVDLTLAHLIAAVFVVAAVAVNLAGLNLAAVVNKVVGVVFALAIAAMIAAPLLAGDMDFGALSAHAEGPWGGWKVVIVWLYVGAWAIYGSELCAAFAPEYRDTARDTKLAMTSIAGVLIAFYALVPLTTVGAIGEEAAAANPVTYGVVALQQVLGSSVAGLLTAVLCATLFVVTVSSAADASRALLGLSQERLTIEQFDRLNSRGAPTVALVVTMVVNLAILAFVGNPVAILIAANLGYMVAITLAVSGFLLLRKDRPDWPRPIRLGPAWLAVAAVLTVFNLGILVVGATAPDLSAGGSGSDALIGLGLLSTGVILFAYRQIVQDRGSITWREKDEVTGSNVALSGPPSV